MNTSIKLPQTIAELHSFMKTAIETFQCSSVSNKNKLNETLAKSLDFNNYDQLSALIKNEKKSKTPSYKNETFEILDPTGEKPSKKVFITESDCDLHIKVEHYTINLQNYDGDFELTIEDSNQPSVEIENISLPCKNNENKIKPNINISFDTYLSTEYKSLSDREKAIDTLKAIINKNNNTSLSFNQVEHYIGSDMDIEDINEWIEDTKYNNQPVTPQDVLDLCDGFDID
jgi:hypothetical protein